MAGGAETGLTAFRTAQEALTNARTHAPGPLAHTGTGYGYGCDGVAATRRITAEHPGTRVVVLTTYADDESIIGALQAGALGYLTKDATRAEIGRAIGA